jgi:hypothetical protein
LEKRPGNPDDSQASEFKTGKRAKEMFNMKELELNIPKVSFLLASWGLLILLGGVINQWFNLSADFNLWLWGGITLLGVAAQLISMVRGMGLNLGFWLVLIIIGWLFTFYVIKFEGGAHIDLFGDLPGVWLILLGLGYIATAFQVDIRFLILAALHLVAGALLELSSRQIATIEILDTYSSLIFGLVGGVPLMVAALPVWIARKQPQERPQYSVQH